MSRRYGRSWLAITAFLVFYASLGAQDKPPNAIASLQASSEDPALRALVEQYFAAYAKKDLRGMIALWSASSPHLSALRKETGEFFASNEDIKLTHLTIETLTSADQNAHLRVAFELSAVDTKTRQPATNLGPTMRTVDCVRQAGLWRIWRDVDTVDDLAELLISAKSAAERSVILEHDKDLVASGVTPALIARGLDTRSQGDLAKAENIFLIAQEVAERTSDRLSLAKALFDLGSTRDMQGDSHQALEYYAKSMKIAEDLKNQPLVVRILTNIGAAQQDLGQLAEAENNYTKALKIAEAIQFKPAIVKLIMNLGEVHFETGNFESALEYFQKELELAEAQDKAGVEVAHALMNIGRVYNRRGNNALAMQYFQRSKAMLEAAGDKTLLTHLLNEIGVIYESQGEYGQARMYYQKSLTLCEQMKDQRGIAAALETIGLMEVDDQQFAPALNHFQKSMAILEALDDKPGEGALLENIGEAQEGLGHTSEALEAFKKGLELAESFKVPEYAAEASVSIAKLYNKERKFDQALPFAQRASEVAGRIASQDLLWRSQEAAGLAYRGLGNQEQALVAFTQAITTIELMRTQVLGSEQQQQGFLSSRLAPYYDMVDLRVSQKRPSEALADAERAKGRALLDVLQNGKVQITKEMTPSEREREQQLQADMVSLNKQKERESGEEKPDASHMASLEGQLESVRLQYSDFQTNLFAAHPGLKTKRGEAQPVSLEEAARLLPDSNSAFLEFVTGAEKTYLFVLTRKQGVDQIVPDLGVYAIPVAAKALKQKAEYFREQLGRRDLAFRPSSRGLFQLLIKPANEQLAGKNALVIVPDGPLWSLPFQALLGNNGRYLLEDYAISYAPSLAVLREMVRVHQNGEQASPSATPSSKLLAMANPVLGKETLTRASAVYRGESLGPLPDAQREAIALKRLYGNEQSSVYTGANAREDRFKAEAGKFQVIHLATHGIFNDANPMYSHILLSAGEADSKEDGLLEAWEIMQMDLRAKLVVLSACETGRGRFSGGEGLIGLTWAFFVAGVPTTVVSQWKVESSSTASLMTAFHRTLKAGEAQANSPFATARALQRAEVQLLHSQQYAHPFYWAGFVVVGNPQ